MPRLGALYFLIKVHKSGEQYASFPLGFPVRPICSLLKHPCKSLSLWFHKLLAPVLCPRFLPEVLLGTDQFLRDLDSVRDGSFSCPPSCSPVSPASVPFTLDVVNMFTNIPWDKGAEACGHFWDLLKHADFPGHPVDHALVVRVGFFVLSHALFTFNGYVYRQLNATAMGSHFSVVYAIASWLVFSPFSSSPRRSGALVFHCSAVF